MLNHHMVVSVQFSSVMSDSLWPHEPQHARPPPGVHPNPCPLSWWCHPTISSSVIPFSSCPQYFPACGSLRQTWLKTHTHTHTHTNLHFSTQRPLELKRMYFALKDENIIFHINEKCQTFNNPLLLLFSLGSIVCSSILCDHNVFILRSIFLGPSLP